MTALKPAKRRSMVSRLAEWWRRLLAAMHDPEAVIAFFKSQR